MALKKGSAQEAFLTERVAEYILPSRPSMGLYCLSAQCASTVKLSPFFMSATLIELKDSLEDAVGEKSRVVKDEDSNPSSRKSVAKEEGEVAAKIKRVKKCS